MRRLLMVLICPAFLTMGCGYNDPTPRESGGRGVSAYAIALNDSSAASQSVPASVQLPLRVAVAQIGEVAPSPSFIETLRSYSGTFAQVDSIPSSGLPMSYPTAVYEKHWQHTEPADPSIDRSRAE